MLSIHQQQPVIRNQYQNFGNRFGEDSGFADYEEVASSAGRNYYDDEDFHSSKDTLDAWKTTKKNLDELATTAESVPIVKTGTKCLSALTSIAIGWAGLRWGATRVLGLVADAANSAVVKGAKKYSAQALNSLKGLKESGVAKLKQTRLYETAELKVSGWADSIAETKFGKFLTETKKSVADSKFAKGFVNAKNSVINFFKNLNYKKGFVETMGIAGGGTAAVNVLGARPVDGRHHNVERTDDGEYLIDGRFVSEEF